MYYNFNCKCSVNFICSYNLEKWNPSRKLFYLLNIKLLYYLNIIYCSILYSVLYYLVIMNYTIIVIIEYYCNIMDI